MGKKTPALLIVLLSAGLSCASTGGPPRASEGLRYKGMSYASWWSGLYSSGESSVSLHHLARTGADWISLVVTGYQDHVRSTSIYRNEGTPSDDDLIQAMNQARRLGLKVMLKPHVDLWNDPDHWRGQIGDEFTTEAEWQDWFAAYDEFIDHYAELAEAQGAEMFCAGVELEGTSHRAAEWRTALDGIRQRFHGPVIYAANWGGEEDDLSWWDAVDIIGIDAYYPLAQSPQPTVDQLKAAWIPHRDALAGLASRWQKPIVFTEIGYRSISGTASHPWDWQTQGQIDLREQADAYQAVMETFDGLSWFAGIFWWYWGTDPTAGGSDDDDYTPFRKPAERILRKWYKARIPGFPRLNPPSKSRVPGS